MKAQHNRDRVNAATIRRQAQEDLEKIKRETRVAQWLGKVGTSQSAFLHSYESDSFKQSKRTGVNKLVVRKDCTGLYEPALSRIRTQRRRNFSDNYKVISKAKLHVSVSVPSLQPQCTPKTQRLYSPISIVSGNSRVSQSREHSNASTNSTQQPKESKELSSRSVPKESFITYHRQLKCKRDQPPQRNQHCGSFGPRCYPNKRRTEAQNHE